MQREELYFLLLKSSHEQAEKRKNNEIDYIEFQRIYCLSFYNCLVRYLDACKNDEQSGIRLKKETPEGEEEKIILTFSGHPDYSFELKTKFLNEYLKDRMSELRFVGDIVEPVTEVPVVVQEPEIPIESEVQEESESVEPEDQSVIEEVQPEEEKVEEDIIPATPDEVETVEVESAIDYSQITGQKISEQKPEIKEDPEETIGEKVVKTEPEQPAQIVELNDKFYCNKYPDDKPGKKTADSFVYDQYLITAENLKIRVNVFPLKYMDSAPVATDVFIAFKGNNGAYRGYISSENGNKMIRATFDQYEFIIRGKWINGNFESSLQLAKPAQIQIDKTQHRPVNPTSTTHEIIEKNGLKLHLFPTDWVNNPKTGVAGALIYSETEKVIMMPDSMTQIPYSKERNNLIQVYWQGKDVNAELMILED